MSSLTSLAFVSKSAMCVADIKHVLAAFSTLDYESVCQL